MNSRLMISLALLIGILAAGGLAYAGESDPNLCYAGQAWAGQCTTQRHWEAGWCYANGDAASCDSLYGDVAAHMAGLVSATSTSAQGVAGIARRRAGAGFRIGKWRRNVQEAAVAAVAASAANQLRSRRRQH